MCLRKLDRSDEALIAVKRALALDPHYEKAYYHHAVILFDQGRYQAALKVIDQILSKNKEHIDFLKLKQKCFAPISAEIFFGVVDLKFTDQNKVKILEFGPGMGSGLSGFNQSHPGHSLFDEFICHLKKWQLPIFINHQPGNYAGYPKNQEFIETLKLGNV